MQHAVEVAVIEPQRAAGFEEIRIPRKLERAADVGHGALAVALGGIGLGAQFIGGRQVLVGNDRAVVNSDRLVDIALLAPDAALRGQCGDVLRVEPRRFLVIAQRAIDITGCFACLRPQHVVVRARLQPDRMVEIGNGARVVALAQIELPAAAIGTGAIAAEADRLLIVLHRAVDKAEVAPNGGAVYVRRGRIGIEIDGGVVVGNGLAIIAARVPGIAAVLVGGRKVRRQRDRLIEVGDGVRNVAAIEIGQATQPIRDARRFAAQTTRLEQAGAGGDAFVGEVFDLGRTHAGVADLRLCAARPRRGNGDGSERSRSD